MPCGPAAAERRRHPANDLLALDRERLAQIAYQMPLMTRRFLRFRSAVLTSWIAIGLLMLSVGAIAVAVTARSEAFGFTALALAMAGATVIDQVGLISHKGRQR